MRPGPGLESRVLFLCLCACAIAVWGLGGVACAQTSNWGNPEQRGWFLPSIGEGNGFWQIGVGGFFWKDRFEVRNLQLLTDVDLAPGLRVHGLFRSNRQKDTLSGFDPRVDEGYVEAYGFRQGPGGRFSGSLRIGRVRYLRFPYPDAISYFDQVPGIEDLEGGQESGYSGAILTLDYAWDGGFGAHFAGIRWGFGRDDGWGVLEEYLSYAHDFGEYRLETRYGQLQIRQGPVGPSAEGYNVFFGKAGAGGCVGFLYEKLEGQPGYTGILVVLPEGPAREAMGAAGIDYARDPEGIGVHVPLVEGTFGRVVRQVPVGGVLVGEIRAERLRTYWQNSQVRNFYEHRIDSWGQTEGKDLVVVMEEGPWVLQLEALVSPHTSFTSKDDLDAWERDREGPAQLSQQVTYRFYRLPTPNP